MKTSEIIALINEEIENKELLKTEIINEMPDEEELSTSEEYQQFGYYLGFIAGIDSAISSFNHLRAKIQDATVNKIMGWE